jgi:rhodanese-related sulfurtransferase
LSPSSARRAEKLGYTNVKVFLDGMPAWKKAKQPLYSSVKYLHQMAAFKNSVVIIDTRPSIDVQVGHIEGAIALPADKIAGMQKSFPTQKTAPIVIVATDHDSALESFKTIRGWGYKNASILKGGLESWKKTGVTVATGNAASKIVYIPKPTPGAMSIEDFKALLAQKSTDTTIIDVRTEDEVSAGTIEGALNIPTDEITDRLAEIPKNKKIVTYCSTGIRAEMAYITLKDKGYGATFLNAKTNFSEDGKYTLSEN